MVNDNNCSRVILSFANRKLALKKVKLIEKPFPEENEDTFIQRLLDKYHGQRGTLEIVFKNGRPEHAIVTLNH